MPATSPADSLMPWQSIMLDYEGRYRTAKKSKRVEVVKEIYKAVYDDCKTKKIPVGLTLQGFSDVLPFLLVSFCYSSNFQKLRNYYGNHKAADPEHLESLSSLGLGRDWTVRRVVWNLKKAEIASIIENETGYQPGTGAYLGCYQRITTRVVQNLSEEERLEYQQIADEWMNNGPPLDVKKEYVSCR